MVILLSAFMRDRQLTPEALAKLLAVHPDTVRRWQRNAGPLRLSQLETIAAIFEVSVSELVKTEGELPRLSLARWHERLLNVHRVRQIAEALGVSIEVLLDIERLPLPAEGDPQ